MRHQPQHGDCVIDTQKPRRKRSRRARQRRSQNLARSAAVLRQLRGKRKAKRVALTAIRSATAPGRNTRLPFLFGDYVPGAMIYGSAHPTATEIQFMNSRYGRNVRRNDAIRNGDWL